MPNLTDLLEMQRMRRMGPKQVMWEHQQDMSDSAKLQAALTTPTSVPQPQAVPAPGTLEQLLALIRKRDMMQSLVPSAQAAGPR